MNRNFSQIVVVGIFSCTIGCKAIFMKVCKLCITVPMYRIDSVIISQYSLKKLDKTESNLVKLPIGESKVLTSPHYCYI